MTKQAALAAGMPEEEIYMISEPEAAAVHCLTELNDIGGNLDVCSIRWKSGQSDLLTIWE